MGDNNSPFNPDHPHAGKYIEAVHRDHNLAFRSARERELAHWTRLRNYLEDGRVFEAREYAVLHMQALQILLNDGETQA